MEGRRLIGGVLLLLSVTSVISRHVRRASVTMYPNNNTVSYEMLTDCNGRNNTFIVPDAVFEGSVFLRNYTNRMNCSVRLISPRQSVFTFKFTSLQTEATNDYVVVTGLTNNSQIRLTANLPQIPRRHETTSNELLVHFHSDGSVLGKGFSLNFEIVLKGDPLSCHYCSGVEHIRYCDVVIQCKTNREVCYVGQQFSTTGQVLYNAGCVDRKFSYCKTGPQPNSCGECCDADFCNNKGCGESLPPHEHRGPICFDCKHLENPSHCRRISTCSTNEACYIEEHKWGDDDQYFNMGCVNKSACPPPEGTDDSSVLRRSNYNCFHCCDGDHCNTNCTGIYVEPLIG